MIGSDEEKVITEDRLSIVRISAGGATLKVCLCVGGGVTSSSIISKKVG